MGLDDHIVDRFGGEVILAAFQPEDVASQVEGVDLAPSVAQELQVLTVPETTL